jgi:hypothetical protein
MGLAAHTKHALKLSLGEQAGNEVIRLLEAVKDEFDAYEANAKAKAAKAVSVSEPIRVTVPEPAATAEPDPAAHDHEP